MAITARPFSSALQRMLCLYLILVGQARAEIRGEITRRAKPSPPPSAEFVDSRSHWFYRDAADTGWPIRGELVITPIGDHPKLIGPAGCWAAADAPALQIEMALAGEARRLKVHWTRQDDPNFSGSKSLAFELPAGDGYQKIQVPLSRSPEYRGTITGLRIDLPALPDTRVKIRSISMKNGGTASR